MDITKMPEDNLFVLFCLFCLLWIVLSTVWESRNGHEPSGPLQPFYIDFACKTLNSRSLCTTWKRKGWYSWCSKEQIFTAWRFHCSSVNMRCNRWSLDVTVLLFGFTSPFSQPKESPCASSFQHDYVMFSLGCFTFFSSCKQSLGLGW